MSTTCMLDAFTVSRQSLGERRENSKWTTKGNDILYLILSQKVQKGFGSRFKEFLARNIVTAAYFSSKYSKYLYQSTFQRVIKFINHNIS